MKTKTEVIPTRIKPPTTMPRTTRYTDAEQAEMQAYADKYCEGNFSEAVRRSSLMWVRASIKTYKKKT